MINGKSPDLSNLKIGKNKDVPNFISNKKEYKLQSKKTRTFDLAKL